MKDSFSAAFDEILKGTGDREKIAEAQVAEFGHRDWTLASPTKDALGRKIVFKDSCGFAYTVSMVDPQGAHVRTYFDPRDSVQSVDLEAHAPTWAEADALMDLALAERSETDRHPVGGRKSSAGMFVTRYRVGRPTLD